MFELTQLIDEVNTSLKQYDYSNEDSIDTQSVHYITYIKQPSLFKVRNLCALMEVPLGIEDNASAKKYFHDVRTGLLYKYGNAILWKELEICFVVLCEHNIYNILEEDGGKAVTQAGFSLNCMLGTCFINKTTFDTFNQSTWGIYFSGDHYKTLRETVANWCEKQKIDDLAYKKKYAENKEQTEPEEHEFQDDQEEQLKDEFDSSQ